MSTISAESLLRLALTTLPEVLNTRSDATMEAPVHRYFWTRASRNSKHAAFFFHHSYGLSCSCCSCSSSYRLNSCWIAAFIDTGIKTKPLRVWLSDCFLSCFICCNTPARPADNFGRFSGGKPLLPSVSVLAPRGEYGLY